MTPATPCPGCLRPIGVGPDGRRRFHYTSPGFGLPCTGTTPPAKWRAP